MGAGLDIQWARTVHHLDEIASTRDFGFDAAEPEVAILMETSDQEFREQKASLTASGLSFPVIAAPLPSRVRVTDQGFNIYVWSEYLKRALDRVSALGCAKIAWSDGRSRVLPVEGETAAARRQALQFLFMLSDLAASHGIDVLVEPLDPRRTNFLNTMDEVEEFIALAGRPNLSSLISMRDLDAIGFDESAFSHHRGSISHVYLENPGSPPGQRLAPRPDDGQDYASFLRALSGIGYTGVVTLPANADRHSLDYCATLIAS
jgi:hypothetical protein